MTIENLAEKTGLSDNFVGNIERGSDIPSMKSLIKIANALGASIDAILGPNLLYNAPFGAEKNKQNYYDKEIYFRIEKLTEKQKAYVLECIDLLLNFER